MFSLFSFSPLFGPFFPWHALATGCVFGRFDIAPVGAYLVSANRSLRVTHWPELSREVTPARLVRERGPTVPNTRPTVHRVD